MRAFFVDELPESGDEITLEGDTFNHLKVVRLKSNEGFLLLDGRGGQSYANLVSLEKRYAIVKTQKPIYSEQSSTFDLAIGIVKKDAFDLCLKMAVELGVRRIIPIESKYAQRYELNHERANRLMIQALEQSNSRWLPELVGPTNITELVKNSQNYSQVIVMGMSTGVHPANLKQLSGELLGVIGPEGGFDSSEEDLLADQKNTSAVHLPTPILRTPTALAALAGVIFTKVQLFD